MSESTAVAVAPPRGTFSLTEYMTDAEARQIEAVLITGNLAPLSPQQRIAYHNAVCKSLGLNPLTKPFEYLNLNGKTVLYALKACSDQLRSIYRTSVTISSREVVEGCYVVTARATMPDGRTDESIGAVPIERLAGEQRTNAMMKAETKAKRRVTLSIHGLGYLDESEVDSIPGAAPARAAVVPNSAPQQATIETTAKPAETKPQETTKKPVAWPVIVAERQELDPRARSLHRDLMAGFEKAMGLGMRVDFAECCVEAAKALNLPHGEYTGGLDEYAAFLKDVRDRWTVVKAKKQNGGFSEAETRAAV